MPRKFLKRYMPDAHAIKHSKSLKIFGELLHKPNLWHLNRRSVANAFAVGLFCAWVPVPFQMVVAAAGAIIFSANLPLSVALVWITNPVTMGPMFYFAYVVGTWIIGVPETTFTFAFSFEWLTGGLLRVWKPFLTGCLILSTISSLIGYFTISYIWRYSVNKKYLLRKLKTKLKP